MALLIHRFTDSPIHRFSMAILLCALCAVFLVTCAPAAPGYEMRPTATTPYDAQVDDLNRRLCAEIGKVYVESERRCVEIP